MNKGKPGWACLVVLTGMAVIVAAAILWPQPREPIHQGRPLRAWLQDFDQSYATTNYRAASQAIQAMGTNTLPFLIRYLRCEDPIFHRQWIWLRRKLHLRGRIDYAVFWHRRAATACGELGIMGAPAFPAMSEAINDQHAAQDVAAALSRMFPDSAPVLTNILATGNVTARCRAADALMTAYSHPTIEEMSRAALLRALRDPDPGVRATAASAFQFWGKNVEVVVAALTQALSDPDVGVRGNAATSLGRFGPAAKTAIPTLLRLLNDTNVYPTRSGSPLHQRIRDTLERIDRSWRERLDTG